jgi:hypothetical protein
MTKALRPLNASSYDIAVSGAYLATKALSHLLKPQKLAPIIKIERENSTKLADLLIHNIEKAQKTTIDKLTTDIKDQYINEIEKLIAQRSRIEFKIERKWADDLIKRVRKGV